LTRWLDGTADDGRRACERAYRVDPDPSVFALESDIPTLVLSGEVDPVTPPVLAELILPGLTNATHLTFPFVGHGVGRSLNALVPGCGGTIYNDFLVDPTSPIDTRCAEAIRAPEFLTELKESRQPMHLVLSIRDGQWPILPVLLLAGLGVALLAYPVAAVGRLLDGRRDSVRKSMRVLVWSGVLLSLAGVAVGAAAFRTTLLEHPSALPFGLVPWATVAGRLGLVAVVAVLLAAALLLKSWRDDARLDVGSIAGLGSVVLLVAATFRFLVSIGVGPV
jgi:hypothetical protein